MERSFAHVRETGGMLRMWSHGLANAPSAAANHLSLILQTLLSWSKPREFAAQVERCRSPYSAFNRSFSQAIRRVLHRWRSCVSCRELGVFKVKDAAFTYRPDLRMESKSGRNSTGCLGSVILAASVENLPRSKLHVRALSIVRIRNHRSGPIDGNHFGGLDMR